MKSGEAFGFEIEDSFGQNGTQTVSLNGLNFPPQEQIDMAHQAFFDTLMFS